MLFKDIKGIVGSFSRGTDFFEIVPGDLQIDSIAPFQFIICQEYVQWTSKDLMTENSLMQKRS